MEIFMPCLPYLIRHVKDNDSLLCLAKMYFSTCAERGMDEEEALLRYKATVSSMLPKDRPKIFLYHDRELTDEDFVLTLKSDPDLPKVPPCHKYCEKVLGSNDLCKTCSYYKGYANADMEQQYALLKFIASSHDNLLSIKGKLTAPRYIFKGYTDLLMNLNEPDPLPVPMLLSIYKAIEGSGGDLYSDDMEAMLTGLREKSLRILMKSSRSGKYSGVSTIPDKRMDKIWQILCLDIINAGDFTLSEAEAFLSGATAKKKPEKKAPGPDTTHDVQLVLFDKDPFAGNDGEHKASDGTTAGDEKGEPAPDTEKPVGNTGPATQSGEANVVEPSDGEAVPELEIPKKLTEEKTDEVSDVDGTSAPEKTGMVFSDGPVHSRKKKEADVSVDNPLYVPDTSCLTFSNPEGMERDYRLCRLAPVEVFDDGMGSLCFVFLLRDNFYVCRPDSLKAKEILENRKLVKICWQPFDIYSLCMKNKVNVKSLYSIMETEMAFFDGKTCASYWMVCSKYVDDLPSCSYEEQHSTVMPFYRRIYAIQSELIKEPPSSFDKIHSYFGILGWSYHRDRSFKDNGRLFEMDSSGKVRFKRAARFNAAAAGYEVSVIVDGLRDISMPELFIIMLGRFVTVKFRRLQIASIWENTLSLFVPVGMYEFMMSYIQIYLDKYAIRTGNREMNVFLSSKYHDPAYPTRPKKSSMTEPVSLLDVFDLLVSNSGHPQKGKLAKCKISLRELGSGSE